MSRSNVIVLDNGTGYTKAGWAGNSEPSFVFPTAIATRSTAAGSGPSAATRTTGASKGAGTTGSNLASKRGIEVCRGARRLWTVLS